jgi:N-acetylmuramoyl-L-alanine amidase
LVDLSPQNSWGYRCRWTEEGLELVVRRPPRSTDLADMLVCIDPGHGPQAGAVGPTGIREQSVNLALATELERCLAGRGARVVLTRRGPRGPSLGDRVALAEGARADFLLSLHHNAVPDGVDPYLNMGTSVYYFHQHCKPLAQHLQKALVAELGLGDLGARCGDLALCRGTYMPSVLLEPAFMISPDHEALVITRDYRRRCANAIADGLQGYLEETLK